MTWLFRYYRGGGPEPVNVTIHGAVYETVSIRNVSNGQIITCDTGSTGEGMATLIIGCKYVLTGSVSGYTSEEQKVSSDNIDLYAMPLGAIYWYGNSICSYKWAGVTPLNSSGRAYFSSETNCINLYSVGTNVNDSLLFNMTGKDLSKYSKVCINIKSFKSNNSTYSYVNLRVFGTDIPISGNYVENWPHYYRDNSSIVWNLTEIIGIGRIIDNGVSSLSDTILEKEADFSSLPDEKYLGYTDWYVGENKINSIWLE